MGVNTAVLRETLSKQLDIPAAGDDTFLEYVISSKLAANLDRIREEAVRQQLEDNDSDSLPLYNEQLSDLEMHNLYKLNKCRETLLEEYKEYVKSSKARRYSVDFDTSLGEENVSTVVEAIDFPKVEDDSLQQLRKRLLGQKKEKVDEDKPDTVDKQIQVEDDLQQELVSDMAQLVASLRQGAVAFHNALEEDSTVLKATEIGLQVTSKSLSTLGTKLKKYHKSKVGFFFYISCVLFIMLSLLVTYFIIKIFPKM
ncbi:SNAP receptor USE1 Ecym_2253 [Eremothecium cymbalariae DBVPG|uniref:Uncharacterized protein n=1 Tax=Eremothecium cymbalariae (strain CBS 270.75 / DBVPG 7215 / KCTC 17166 / NRRL Y-17582) TaxID=931890 RepID=G8JPP4_ERECY|nr:Hypothetical protein Ecym_2253 [Eremothecium cymbalariae DBVPG\